MKNLAGLSRFNQSASPQEWLQYALMRDLSVGQMRAMSPLPEDAQRVVDNAVVRVGLDRLTIVADLLAAGLRFPLADPLSVTEVQWDTVNEVGGAQRTMDPEARGENQLPNRTPNRTPVFLTTDDFFLGIRTLRASERVGQPLDTTLIEQATRRVNEAIEDQAINGAALNVHGYGAPGILNAPNVNTFTYGSNEAWDAAGKTGDEILADVLGMINVAITAKKYGPYNLYVPTLYGTALAKDFKANGSDTVLQRLQAIEAGGRNLVIKQADQLPANRTALIQMTSDVIDVIDGQRPVTVPWTSPSGFTLHWLVMAIMIVRVRSDYNSKSGVVTGNV